MITSKEVLIKTKEYLETYGWRKGGVPKEECGEDMPDNVALCLQDALSFAIILHGKPNSIKEYFKMQKPIINLFRDYTRYGYNIAHWNDTADKEKVFKTLDEAIASCSD